MRTVAAGEALLDPAITRDLVRHYLQAGTPERSDAESRTLAKIDARDQAVFFAYRSGLVLQDGGR